DREPCAGIGLPIEAELRAPALLGDEARVTEERHEVELVESRRPIAPAPGGAELECGRRKAAHARIQRRVGAEVVVVIDARAHKPGPGPGVALQLEEAGDERTGV